MKINQDQHPLLVQSKHDDQARQEFARSLRAHLLEHVQPGIRSIYKNQHKPDNEAFNDRHEIRQRMLKEPYYRLFSASLRTAQELMWDSVVDAVELDLPRLRKLYAETRDSPSTRGTLTLNNDLKIPSYHSAVDIHLQPGGYHTEQTEQDLAAGAIYDRGVFLYANGKFGDKSDLMGHWLIDGLFEYQPDLKPRRILELGCTVGNSTLAHAEAWPDAELHAIDVAAPCLRYAHARAEQMHKVVHFSQQNAEQTNFPDQSFDLIVSHILFHETSTSAMHNILSECHRLLSPGGIMAHLDLPREEHFEDPLESFLYDWEAHNNNETFHALYKKTVFTDCVEKAGFSKKDITSIITPYGWPLVIASRSEN